MSSKNQKIVTGAEELNSKMVECPFTWEMGIIDSSIFTDYKPHDEEDEIPLLRLMRIIMMIYVQVEEKKDNTDTLENIAKCEEIIALLKEEAAFYDAVQHVVQATKYYALRNLVSKDKIEAIFEKIKVLDPTNEIERSTINACRSICWSKFHYVGKEKAIAYIRKALEDSPDYHLWHFILGKNLRRIRRDSGIIQPPCSEEKNAFLKAYEETNNAIYGLFVAQMFRESGQTEEALRMYREIFQRGPTCDTIYLRLALGFIQLHKFSEAENCLDEVADRCANDSIYLHYRGRYYMKLEDFNKAANFLKEAADMGNYPASMDYIRCMLKINKSFDATNILLNLLTLKESKNFPKQQLQTLFINIALSYLRKKDMENAMHYFLQCIEIDPTNEYLTKLYSLYNPGKPLNVYFELANEVLPVLKIQQIRGLLNESSLKLYNDLNNHYKNFMENQFQSTQNAFHRIRI